MRPGRSLVLGVAAALYCGGAAAQAVSAPGGVSLPGFSHDAGASFLAVRHRVAAGRWGLAMDGLLAAPDGRDLAPGARVSARYDLLPTAGLSILGRYGAFGTRSRDPFGGTEAGGEIQLKRRTLEAWVSWTRVRPARPLPGHSAARTGAGVRWSTGGAHVGLTALGSTFSDSASVRYDTVFTVAGYPFTSHRSRAALAGFRYLDLEADADLFLGPLAVGVAVGGRKGNAQVADEGWGRVRASFPLPVGGLRLEVSGGVRPTIPERALPKARFLSVGMSWRPSRGSVKVPDSPETLARAARLQEASPSFEAAEADDGGVRTLVLRNVAATTVEVMGDFTDWESLKLAPLDPTTWSTEAEVGPGTYHYLVRLDGGAWGVPTGLPRVSGDFGRETGILVVVPAAAHPENIQGRNP